MAKEVKKILKLIIEGGKATPAPPLGPSLAQQGINIGDFCNQFNQQTKGMEGVQIPVEVTIYDDRTFSFVLKKPSLTYLLKKAAGLEKGSSEAGKKIVAKLSEEEIRKIAEEKISDLNTQDIEKAIKIVKGVAKSMGIVVE